jgi:hypothetical protein
LNPNSIGNYEAIIEAAAYVGTMFDGCRYSWL